MHHDTRALRLTCPSGLLTTIRKALEKAVLDPAAPDDRVGSRSLGCPRTAGRDPRQSATTVRAINLIGIWANNTNEVVYFKTDSDGTGAKLDGGNIYTITFPKLHSRVRRGEGR